MRSSAASAARARQSGPPTSAADHHDRLAHPTALGTAGRRGAFTVPTTMVGGPASLTCSSGTARAAA